MTKIEKALILDALNDAYSVLTYYRPEQFIDLEAEKGYDNTLSHLDTVRRAIEGEV